MRLFFLLSLFLLSACKDSGEVGTPEITIDPYPFHTGLDINGFFSYCNVPVEEACTQDILPGDEFAEKCSEIGNEARKCGCHQYLCNGPAYTGRDLDGELRECHADNGLNCSAEFTAADQYAADCKAAGNLPVACGCHDFICVEVN